MNFRMRNFFRIVAVVSVFSLVLMPSVAFSTGIPVFDGGNFSQNIISALQSIQQVYNQVTQLQNQATQIQYKLKSLKTLGSGSFNQLNGLLNGNINDLGAFLSSVNGIGYTLGSIRNQYDALFPQGTKWENVKMSEYSKYFGDWNDEVTNSARSSMEAQSVLSRLQSNYQQMIGILSQSRSADGEVRQLQASNEMLSVIGTQMGDLTHTMAATGRVIATAEAAGAAEKRASQRAAELSMQDFTKSSEVKPVYSKPPKLNN